MTKKITTWYIVVAVLFIVAGMFAIIEPGVAGLGVTLLVGWLLIFGGISHLIGAFKGGGAGRVIFQVLIGIVYIMGGFYCLTHPLLAVGTLTLLLAAIIVAEGAVEIILGSIRKGESCATVAVTPTKSSPTKRNFNFVHDRHPPDSHLVTRTHAARG